MKNALIIGGSSGLGLELGKLLAKEYKVIATGRKLPAVEDIRFVNLDISEYKKTEIESFLSDLPNIDLLIIAAGFFQEGTLSELSEQDVSKMIDLGLKIPILITKKILKRQKEIPIFIPITSTSQWTPRLKEPVYNAIKGGLGMFVNAVSLDPNIKKTLLVGPAGMKTRFWENSDMDVTKFLDPKWVAQQILEELKGEFSYKFIQILRDPPRVILETKR